MSKPNIINKKKELSVKDVANIICDAIQDQPTFSRTMLLPVIEALLKAYTISNNQYVVERNQTERLRAFNEADFNKIYWQRVVKMICPDTIQQYYDELINLKEGLDFNNPAPQSHLAIPKGYNYEKHNK